MDRLWAFSLSLFLYPVTQSSQWRGEKGHSWAHSSVPLGSPSKQLATRCFMVLSEILCGSEHMHWLSWVKSTRDYTFGNKKKPQTQSFYYSSKYWEFQPVLYLWSQGMYFSASVLTYAEVCAELKNISVKWNGQPVKQCHINQMFCFSLDKKIIFFVCDCILKDDFNNLQSFTIFWDCYWRNDQISTLQLFLQINI